MWDKILAVLLLASSAGAYTVQGNLTVTGGGLTVGTSSFTVAGGSATVAYQMAAGSFSGAATGLTGINGPSISLSTIPLAALAPNGAALNQVVGYNGSGWSPQTLGTISTVGITSACAAGYFLSTATYSNGLVESGGCVSVSALPGPLFTVGASSFIVSGGSVTAAYSLTAGSLVDSGQGNIGGQLTVGSTLTVQGSAFSVGSSSFSVAGGSATVAYSLTAGSLSDSGSETVGGQVTIVSTLTVQGNAFSVGSSSFVVTASSVGIRTSSPGAALDVAGSVRAKFLNLTQTGVTLTSCGTSPTIFISGQNLGEFLTGSATGTACTLNFPAPFAANFICCGDPLTGTLGGGCVSCSAGSTCNITSLISSGYYSYQCF